MLRAVIMLASFVSLAGCQTSYQKTSFTGGFDDLQLSDDTYRVSVRGNAFTSTERAEEIALLRAAELTLQKGYARFALVGGGVSREQTGTDPVSVNRVGNTLIASGGDPVTKPRGTITIRMLKQADPAFVNGLDAKLIEAQLRPKLTS